MASDKVLARRTCRARRWVAGRFPGALAGAVAAEEASSYDDETGRSPSDKQRASEFISVDYSGVTLILVLAFGKDKHYKFSSLDTSRVCYIQLGWIGFRAEPCKVPLLVVLS